jgi:hypothetical protein
VLLGCIALSGLLSVGCHFEPRFKRLPEVTGRISDEDTGAPLGGAFVVAKYVHPSLIDGYMPFISLLGVTDAEGLFRIPARRKFAWERVAGPAIYVVHPSYGFVPARYNGPLDEVDIRLSVRKYDGMTDQSWFLRVCDFPASDFPGVSQDVLDSVEAAACGRPLSEFPNGQPRARGARNSDGQRTGPWEFFDESGRVWARGSFLYGEPDLYWDFYDPAGKLIKRADYCQGFRLDDGTCERASVKY